MPFSPVVLRALSLRKRKLGVAFQAYTQHNSTRGISDAFRIVQTLDKSNTKLASIAQRKIQERNELVPQRETIFKNAYMSPEATQRMKQLKALDAVYYAWCDWQNLRQLLIDTVAFLDDEDSNMRALAAAEIKALEGMLSKQTQKVMSSLLSLTAATEHLSVMLELRPGVGGAESSLFLGELLEMYTRLAGICRWTSTTIKKEEKVGGGLTAAVIVIHGSGAYNLLRWESGVHRVQRVPQTESSGRIHTSTVTVMALPHVEGDDKKDNHEEIFKEEDVKIEVMRARGAGGQHVNKTESAVRLTHIPTGMTVSMQDERSQHVNKARAFQILRARLLDRKLQDEATERRDTRRQLVKSGDRNEKIRTYNFAQGRVTDHRINTSTTNIASVMQGVELQAILEAVKFNQEQLLIGN